MEFSKPKINRHSSSKVVTFSMLSIGNVFKIQGDLRTFIKIACVNKPSSSTNFNCVVLTSETKSEGSLNSFGSTTQVHPVTVEVKI